MKFDFDTQDCLNFFYAVDSLYFLPSWTSCMLLDLSEYMTYTANENYYNYEYRSSVHTPFWNLCFSEKYTTRAIKKDCR